MDQRAFWRWLTGAARPYLGWLLIGLGAVAVFLCWYGVSGQAEPGQQLPYFASDGLAAFGLFIVGAALVATGDASTRRARLDETERKVGDLHTLLVIDGDQVAAPRVTAEGVVALPTGTSYHRPTCALVNGKAAVPVDDDAIAARSLTPCRVCDPSGAPSDG